MCGIETSFWILEHGQGLWEANIPVDQLSSKNQKMNEFALNSYTRTHYILFLTISQQYWFPWIKNCEVVKFCYCILLKGKVARHFSNGDLVHGLMIFLSRPWRKKLSATPHQYCPQAYVRLSGRKHAIDSKWQTYSREYSAGYSKWEMNTIFLLCSVFQRVENNRYWRHFLEKRKF